MSDESTGVIETDSTQTVESTGSAGPAQGTQDASTSQATADTQTADPTTGTQTDTGTSSSATDTSSQNATQIAPTDEAWQKRYDEVRTAFNRKTAEADKLRQEHNGLRERFKGVDPDAIRAYREQAEKAKQRELPVWNRENPNSPRFYASVERWKAYKAAYAQAATPEDQAVLKRTLGSAFSQQEQEALASWEQHQAQFTEQLAADPEGTIASIVDQRVQNALADYRMQADATTSVTGWFDDPKNQPLIKAYGKEMHSRLRDGVPWAYVQEWATTKSQLDALQTRIAPAEAASASARAKNALLKEGAAITRDGVAKPVKDIAAEAQRIGNERGWPLGDARYLDLIDDLRKSNR